MRVKVVVGKEEFEEFKVRLRECDFYCPCSLIRDNTTKCLCENFRIHNICECNIYQKENDI